MGGKFRADLGKNKIQSWTKKATGRKVTMRIGEQAKTHKELQHQEEEEEGEEKKEEEEKKKEEKEKKG